MKFGRLFVSAIFAPYHMFIPLVPPAQVPLPEGVRVAAEAAFLERSSFNHRREVGEYGCWQWQWQYVCVT